MTPTMNMTKPVTTAIATFVSIDKFIISPSIMVATPVAPFFGFCFSYIPSNFGVLMVARDVRDSPGGRNGVASSHLTFGS
jgi:hypothetical protein